MSRSVRMFYFVFNLAAILGTILNLLSFHELSKGPSNLKIGFFDLSNHIISHLTYCDQSNKYNLNRIWHLRSGSGGRLGRHLEISCSQRFLSCLAKYWIGFVSDFGLYRRQTSQQGTILVPGLVAPKPSRTRTSRLIFLSGSSRTTFRVTSSRLL